MTQLVKELLYKSEDRKFDSRLNWILHDLIALAAVWSWDDPDSNGNGYNKYLVGGKGDRCVGLTNISSSYADCLEIVGASNC